MSRVVITGNASGTGDFTLAAPNSNTDRTLTLPDITGTVLTDSAGVLNIGAGQVYKDASGNVGIGTSSPSYRVEVKGPAATAGQLSIHDGTGDTVTSGNNAGSLLFQARDSSIRTIAEIDSVHTTTNGTGGAMVFQTRVSDVLAERMRIDSTGNLLVGTTTSRTGSDSLSFEPTNSLIWFQKNGTASQSQVIFQRDTTGSPTIVGSISTTGTSTAYNTSSDYRLKENVVEITDGIDRVKLLNPSRFNFIADSDTTVDGFLAHEAQAVVPEAVTGTHNEVDADGNPVMQGIDQSKLVPLLTAALQETITKIEEQQALIQSLTTRITALENA